METRKYDMLTDMLANPNMSLGDFITLGFTPENTSLHSRDTYMNDPWVLKQESLQNSQGEFDKEAFNTAYDNALFAYNQMANSAFVDKISKTPIFHRDNIYAEDDRKKSGPEFQEYRTPNPYDITSSTYRLGKEGDRTKSVDELAQANRVLLNPTTAGDDLSKAEWGDSPNDSFWGYFTDTLVQAQWDEAGEHRDLFSGKMVHHEKGLMKTDADGNFYYEKLDGRDIYGRRVLNKMNVLTTDGSWANQYDFFDSDDILLKSIGGSVLKNLALVGSMWLPYVGPVVLATSIGSQLVGIAGVLGKMTTGSESPTFSAMEGWAKSMSRLGALTEYAQEHPFSWENMINMIGDVAGQLREQRAIFNMVPGMFMGKGPDLAKLAKQFAEQYKKEKFAELTTKKLRSEDLLAATLQILIAAPLEAASKARLAVESVTKTRLNLGAVLSKAYMTAITVQDTYGEAKHAGATDLEATMLAIGHAAGEYAILNTGLGEWILPELRASGRHMLAVAKARTQIKEAEKSMGFKDAMSLLSNASDKRDWLLKIFRIGKGIASAEYATGEMTAKAMGAAAIGESLEEVSEEILADFSKACFDISQWLLGDDTRMNTFGYNFSKGEWDSKDFLTRYGMSAIGGFIGGGLANTSITYNQMKSFSNMTSEQALLEIIYMARNGQIKDFVREVNKMELGDKNLSTRFEEVNGKLLWAPGTKEDNQDLAIKKLLLLEVKTITSLLEANGGKSDNQFLSELTIKDLRFNKLTQAKVAGKYLQEYNSLNSQLVRLTNEINDIIENNTDSNNDGIIEDYEARKNKLTEDLKKSIKVKEDKRKEIIKKIKEFDEGKHSYEFIADTLYELSTPINHNQIPSTFELYVKANYGKALSEVSKEDLPTYLQKYKEWVASKGKDATIEASQTFRYISEINSQMLLELAETFKHINPRILEINTQLQRMSSVVSTSGMDDSGNLFSQLAAEIGDNTSIQGLPTLRTNAAEWFLRSLGDDAITAELNDLYAKYPEIAINNELATQFRAEYHQLMMKHFPQKLLEIVLPYITLGFINRESRMQLNTLLLLLLNASIMELSRYEEEEALNVSIGGLSNPWADFSNMITRVLEQIKNLNETPVEKYFNKFSVSMTGVPMDLTTLIDSVNDSFKNSAKDTSSFKLEEDTYELVKNAINLLELFKSAILAARTEINPFVNIYGYNATLNEVAKKTGIQAPELAEIDHQTADIFIAEIDADLTKLSFLKTLQDINRGQKLALLDRVSTKTGVLFYKRLQELIDSEDDDELKKTPAFLELATTLESLSLYKDLLAGNDFNLLEALKTEFLKQTIVFEDAIYNFFNSNESLLERFITPTKLSLSKDDGILLNEGTDHMDDNSMVWYLASRVAIKASDFYFKYKEAIDPNSEHPLAPITTQELAVYLDYANIMNGDLFAKVVKIYLKNMLHDWREKSSEERKKYLKENGYDLILAEDKFTKYAFNFLPVPKYTNTVLTEGISGAGKTDGTFNMLKLLLSLNASDKLLENTMIVHGANPDSAKVIASNIGLKSAKTFGRVLFLKHISSDYKELEKDKEGNYKVSENDYFINEDGEIRTKNKAKNSTKPPKVVFLDEISNFTNYEMDLIDEWAQRNGVTVIAAGDFTQSGVRGSHKLTIEGFSTEWNALLMRTDFIRSPKMGVSMRTDNVLKTKNQYKILAYLLNPRGELSLDYYLDDTGIYGDKVYSAASRDIVFDLIMLDIQVMIDSLKENERIGYMYNNPESPLYKELSLDKYRKHIDLYQGNSAQGLESQYFIIDFDETNHTLYRADLYTGITRAKQGSIIYNNYTDSDSFVHISSVRSSENIKDYSSPEVIKRYAAAKKGRLTEILEKGEDIEYKPRTKLKGKEKVAATVAEEKPTLKPGIPVASTETKLPEKPTENPPQPANNPSEDSADTPPTNPTEGEPSEGKSEKLSITVNPPTTSVWEPKFKVGDYIGKRNGDTWEYYKILEISEDSYKVLNLSTGEELNIKENDSFVNFELEGDLTFSALNGNLEHLPPHKFNIGDIITDVDETEFYLISDITYIPEVGKFTYTLIPQGPISGVSYILDVSEVENSYDILKEEQPTEQPPVDVIMDDEFDSDQQQHEAIDTSSTPPKSEVAEEELVLNINMLLHSFNTFELGVQYDKDGNIISPPDWIKVRIDGVNGLLKIKKFAGLTREQMIQTLGNIRSYLFNTEDKVQLENILKKYLELDNISITFALKSSVRIAPDKNDGNYFGRGNANPYEKHPNDVTILSGSIEESKPHLKTIVAVISDGTLNVLEIPLLALSSPFTLMRALPEFSEVLKTYDSYDKSLNTYLKVRKLISDYAESEKYANLINLFQLYTVTDNVIWKIDDPDFTIAKNFHSVGPAYMATRGDLLMNGEYQFDLYANDERNWVDVSTIAAQGGVSMSNILTSLYGVADGFGDKLITNPGHPFVLYSNDVSIKGDAALIDRYLYELANPNAEKKIAKFYVLPPSADLTTYFENLGKILSTDKATRNSAHLIGEIFTNIKMLKLLMLDKERFEPLWNAKLPNFPISELEELLDRFDPADKANWKTILSQTEDWKDRGYGHTTLLYTIEHLLNNVMSRLAYDSRQISTVFGTPDPKWLDVKAIQLMESILSEQNKTPEFRIRYHTPLPNATVPPIRGFIRCDTSNYTIRGDKGLPYKINGKIDSQAFRGDLNEFVSNIIDRFDIASGHIHDSLGEEWYWDWKKKSSKQTIQPTPAGPLSPAPKTPAKPITKKQEDPVETLVKIMKAKTGFDIQVPAGTLLEDAKILIVLQLNSNGFISFILGGEIINTKNTIGSTIELYDSNNTPIYSLDSVLVPGGNYEFNVVIGESKYSAEFSSKKDLLLTPEDNTTFPEITLSISEGLSYNDYMLLADGLLNELYNGNAMFVDEELQKIVATTSMEELLEVLLTYISEVDDSGRVADLLAIKEAALTEREKQIIDDFINIEHIMLQYDNTQLTCATPIKILF